ncbi:MAG: hypothetical protein PUE08_00215 [Eubacteriales bacterium]|nr:hypothetical protein [Eubacteriales bacterium]
MKYFSKVLVVLLIVLAVIFGFSYHYREKKNADNIILTTADMSKKQTTKAERQLICQNSDGGYQLYLDGDKVILAHEGIEKTLEGWASNVKLEKPQMFYRDYDEDGEGELLIKLATNVTNINGQEQFVYNLYLFEPIEKNGKSDFSVISATSNTWKAPFENAIKAEMSQLESCDKIIQFVMDDADTPIVYNEDTGITRNKYVGFACALRNNKGGYGELERWNKGIGLYSVSKKGEITLDIQIKAFYKNVDDPQYIGNIHTDVAVIDGKFGIVPNTISFVANEEYEVASPVYASEESWKSTIYNSYEPTFREDNSKIDWIETKIELNPTFKERTLSFSGLSSQIKCIEKIVVTPTEIKFTAQEGYTFDESLLDKFGFSVTIRPDYDDSYNIEYKGEIKNKDGRSVLIIHFDRAYDRNTLDGMLVKFGS